MNNDLISRQAAIDAVEKVIGDNRSISICEAIRQLPPIQPRTGQWRKITKSLYASKGTSVTGDYECSVCRHIILNIPNGLEYTIYQFCYHCGAKMEGETE